jgi:inward rectifier potassium channel
MKRKRTQSSKSEPTILGRAVPIAADGSSLAGFGNGWMADVYHFLLTARWSTLFLALGILYILANLFFALLYLLLGAKINNAVADSFWDVFFFSAQTLTTVGYGNLSPQGPMANVLVCVESFFGLMGFAMASGLAFAKFSRPTAKVVFSQVAVVDTYEGQPALMFRMANGRTSSRVIEARLSAVLMKTVLTEEGNFFRKLYDLKFLRSKSPSFLLTWTAIHIIDAESPFWNETAESLKNCQAQVTVTLTGIEGSFSQTIHAAYSYRLNQILFEHKFRDIFVGTDLSKPVFDYSRFHETISAGAGHGGIENGIS